MGLDRIERLHDLLASVCLAEYDPAVDRLRLAHDEILALPLVGLVDARRADDITGSCRGRGDASCGHGVRW